MRHVWSVATSPAPWSALWTVLTSMASLPAMALLSIPSRSQLEARWAAYFDRRGIAWEYEPARFDGWVPDFRLTLDGAQVYAEIKPVVEFPVDVAQRILGAGCGGDVLILGQGPRHAWRYRNGGWTSAELAQ